MKKALTFNGFKYICVGINKNTKSKFWLFEGTKELNNFKDNLYQKERDKF